jgi:cholesterol 7alpha-monooxygenase
MNIQYLMEKCPTLDSTYLEVLRLVNGAFSIRTVLQDTMVSGRVLKAGNSVIIPYRELHYNPNIWGSTTNSFDPDRFARHPKLAGHASYRPFGGGVSYCPGRHLAKAEVCGFVAAFINRFDFVVAPMADGEPQPFPRLDNTKPATGISSCMPHMDLLVNVTPRK